MLSFIKKEVTRYVFAFVLAKKKYWKDKLETNQHMFTSKWRGNGVDENRNQSWIA